MIFADTSFQQLSIRDAKSGELQVQEQYTVEKVFCRFYFEPAITSGETWGKLILIIRKYQSECHALFLVQTISKIQS